MNRYLLNISYIGTGFRGIQRTKNSNSPNALDLTTIQGYLEHALRILRPINPIDLVLSSRTDAGVHALQSSVHVDLEKANGDLYPPQAITQTLNTEFYKLEVPIRVLNTIHVPNTFHCRYNARSRTYMYRLAVSKVPFDNSDEIKTRKCTAFIPIEELNRCCFLQNSNFDAEALKRHASLFLGRHDFRTFMGVNKNGKQKHPMYGIRTINDIKVEKSSSMASSFDAEKANELYNYWTITINGRSFLYKQVRRIVGTLISVAHNRITSKDIYEMLTIPSKHSWDQRIFIVPAYGLYLCKVHYNENDLKFDSNSNQ